MSDRRHIGLKEVLYAVGILGTLGSAGWLFRLANAVEAGKKAEEKVSVMEPRLYAVEAKAAVLESKVDYMVTTLGKIDRRMDRDRR